MNDGTGASGSGGTVVAIGIAAVSGLVGLTAGALLGYRAGKRAALAPRSTSGIRSGPTPGSYAAIQAEAARGR